MYMANWLLLNVFWFPTVTRYHPSLYTIYILATLAVLDQTTLTSMSGSTLIFSTIFSRVFLKEPCTSLVLVQVCLLLIGASLMLIFSSKEMKEFNL